MELTGGLFIGTERRQSDARFHAYDPSAGADIDDAGFASASEQDVADACAAAEAAFLPYSAKPLE